MLNLDTHILLFALSDQLTAHEREILCEHRWGISGIVLWEIARLFQKGRTTLSLADPALARHLKRIHIWPVGHKVCMSLLKLDFQGDPADELIAATSVAWQVPLLTRDERIRTSRVVRIL